MRVLILTVLFSFAAMAGSTAATAQDMYAGGNLGINYTHDGEIAGSGFDTAFAVGYAIGGYVGFDMGDYRLEGEVSYRANDIDDIGGISISSSSVTTMALMANAFYDFDSGSPIVPYVGGGLGVGFSTLELGGGEGDATALAFQLIAGGAYKMSDTLELTLDYRLFSMGTPKYVNSGVGIKQEYTNSALMFGVRTRF